MRLPEQGCWSETAGPRLPERSRWSEAARARLPEYETAGARLLERGCRSEMAGARWLESTNREAKQKTLEEEVTVGSVVPKGKQEKIDDLPERFKIEAESKVKNEVCAVYERSRAA